MDRPGRVAHVALELAHDCRDRVGREAASTSGIEAVDGLDEREARDLLEVLTRLGRIAVAAREAASERQMALDQFVSRGVAAARAKLGESGCDFWVESLAGHRTRMIASAALQSLNEGFISRVGGPDVSTTSRQRGPMAEIEQPDSPEVPPEPVVPDVPQPQESPAPIAPGEEPTPAEPDPGPAVPEPAEPVVEPPADAARR